MYRLSQKRGVYQKRASRFSNFNENRFRIARAAMLAFGGLLIIRLFILQIVDAQVYRALASQQRDIYRDLFPERGEVLIQDHKTGELTPLATNKDLYLVYANPNLIEDPIQVASDLAPLLGIDLSNNHNFKLSTESITGLRISARNPSAAPQDNDMGGEYQQLLNRLSKPDDPYEPLAHGIEESVVQEIRALNIAGIDVTREPVRFYPLNEIGAHIVGFVGADGDEIAGRYGIERVFESELAGEKGYFEGEKDVAGRWIPVGRRELKLAIDGATVVLTIDRTIQYFACSRLSEAVERHGAAGGAVVIAEVKTGAILAMCGVPDFDPNTYSQVEDISVYNNPITFNQYEPGSVFKVITMAAALDTGELTPDATYEDTGEVKIGPYKIRNSDNKAHGIKTMTEVLEESLNTGAIFAANKVGIARFYDYVGRFGFGEVTGIELPNEAQGDISALNQRGDIYLATASFGQGVAVTPLQLLASVGAIANQGKLMRPYLLDEIRTENGVVRENFPQVRREVISPHTAALLSGMMVNVVEGTHGRRAGVAGYYVAGKTGTAQIPRRDAKGYEQGAHIGTFVGFAPVEDPKFVMLTRIDRPQDVRFAESTAAPLFGEIAKFLLQYFEIKPTRPITSDTQK